MTRKISSYCAIGTLVALFVISVNNTSAGGKDPQIKVQDGIVHGNFMDIEWQIDRRCVLPRGQGQAFDSHVVGDPCILWDSDVNTWRMFYFASGEGGTRTGMALSRSAEAIAPGDWKKIGLVQFSNPEVILTPSNWHKWWVIMDAKRPNRAARINGKYWSMFVTSRGGKNIQVASSERLAGPWTVRKMPVLSPDPEGIDGKHCDTVTGFWFEERKQVMVIYKAYPELSQEKDQPGAPFGSATVVGWWHPDDEKAQKGEPVLRPGQNLTDWNRGWCSGVQLLYDQATATWYGLTSGSPTPPEDDSHREPVPSLGGWVRIKGPQPDEDWEAANDIGPFRMPKDLTEDEVKAGLGVNFWRHHLLVTPGGKARIFFNSGPYGKEQMYSLVPKSLDQQI